MNPSTANRQSRIKPEIIVLSLVIILLLVGTVFDSSISQALMNQNSIFGTIFQNYGLIFPSIVIFMSAQIFFHSVQMTHLNIFSKLSVIFLTSLASLYETWQAVKIALYYTVSSLNNLNNKAPIGAANNDGGSRLAMPAWYTPTLILLTLCLTAIGFSLCHKWLTNKNDAEMQRLIYVALAGIVAVFAANTIVDNLKMLWGRSRPYEMNSTWSNFTSWLQINGINGHKSFPSGHSQQGWIALFLPLFVSPEKIVKRRNVFMFSVTFGSLMAFSRLRIGAHFLSDVTVGSFISILIIYSLAHLLNEELMGSQLK